MRKIVIINNGTAYNRGCQALTESIISMVRAIDKKTTMLVYTQYPEYDKSVFTGHENVKFFIYPEFTKKFSYAFKWKAFIPKQLFMRNDYVKALKDADLVISSGGDTLSSDYGTESLQYHLTLIEIAHYLKKKVLVLGASVGPFTKEIDKKALSILKRCSIIAVREEESQNYLSFHSMRETVKLVADPAFLLTPKRVNFLDPWFSNSSITVGIGMSQGIARFSRSSYSEYLQSFVHLCASLIGHVKARIILIPHVFGPSYSNDDRYACESVYRSCDVKENISIANLDFSAAELKYIIGKCDIFIGARTHSTIASLSQCIPTISIAYSIKAYGINKQVFGHTKYVLDVKTMNADGLYYMCMEVLEKKYGIKEYLTTRIPDIKEKALYNQEILHAFV